MHYAADLVIIYILASKDTGNYSSKDNFSGIFNNTDQFLSSCGSFPDMKGFSARNLK
jgi:hypothetical protein